MRDALRRGMGDLTYSQVRDNFEQRQTTGEFQRAPGQKHDTGRQFTTREAIAEELATIKHMQQGQSTVEPIMRQEDAADHARTPRVPESSTTKSHRRGARPPRTGYMACRGWRAAAKPRPLRPFARARSGTDTSLKDSRLQVEPPASSATPGYRLTPCKVFWRGEVWSRAQETRTPGTSICSTSPASPAPGRCNRFSKRLGHRTGFCSLATPGSTRASMPENPSSRCKRPECGHRTSTRSCARKTRNCYAPSNISLATRRPPAFNFFSSSTALPRFPTTGNASRPSPGTMSRDRRTRWLSRPTMPAAATSTMPFARSCRAAVSYPKTITR